MHISKRQDGADECECMANMRLENASESKKECKIVINDVRNINKIIKSISRQRKTFFFLLVATVRGFQAYLGQDFLAHSVFFLNFCKYNIQIVQIKWYCMCNIANDFQHFSFIGNDWRIINENLTFCPPMSWKKAIWTVLFVFANESLNLVWMLQLAR